MDLLEYVLNSFIEASSFVIFRVDMHQIYLSSCKWYGNVNGT